MRATARTVCWLAMAVVVRAAVDPFYRVGVVVGAERRQLSSDTPLGSSSSEVIGQPTFTSTSTSATPTSSPFLLFRGNLDITTCGTAELLWSYSGPADAEMSLLVTNANIPQGPAPSSDGITRSPNTLTARAEMTTMISSDGVQTYYTEFLSVTLDPTTRAYRWNPVNLPKGWYRLESNISSSSFHSTSFYVTEGPDTSCVLPPASSSSSSSSETPSPTSEPGQTDSPTPVPVGKASNVGAIAGGVVGGVVGIALILLLLLFLRRRSRHSHLAGSPPKSRFLGAWGNLGSFESKSSRTPGSAGAGNARPDHNRDDSMGGPMILSQSSSPAATRLGHGDESDENMPYQEKGFNGRSMSVESQSPFSDIPIAVYDGSGGGSRPTRHSSLSSTHNFAMGRRSMSQTFPESVHNSIASSYPSGFGNYTIPPSPTLVNPSSAAFYPSSTSVSPQAVTPHPRKTPRKPVPSYNPDDPTMAGAEDSRTSIPSDVEDRDSVDAPIRQSIRHNDSFNSLHSNGKQLHILIPDMPPPQRN